MKWFIFLASVGLTLPAFAEDRRTEIMIELLDQYAEQAGQLDVCRQGPGKDGVSELLDQVADWKFPGWWSSWFGGKSAFRENLQTSSDLAFSLGRLEGCPSPILIGTTLLLVDTIEVTLRREMER